MRIYKYFVTLALILPLGGEGSFLFGTAFGTFSSGTAFLGTSGTLKIQYLLLVNNLFSNLRRMLCDNYKRRKQEARSQT